MKHPFSKLPLFGLALLLCLNLAACGSDSSSNGTTAAEEIASDADCTVCHSDIELLKTKVTLPEFADGEEVLTAEEFSQRFYVDVEAMGAHGRLQCETCHTEGDAIEGKAWHPAIQTLPTFDGGTVCASCHNEDDNPIVTNFQSSLHFTMSGVARGLQERLQPLTTFDAERGQEAFDAYFYCKESPSDSCYNCHATCGSCHVSNPAIAGKGLVNNHQFAAEPDPETSCMPCHYENGEIYEGMDTHAVDRKMTCVNCHVDQSELHGDASAIPEEEYGPLYHLGPNTEVEGPRVRSMADGIVKAACADCHAADIAVVTEGHSIAHMDNLDCYACHSQPYGQCTGCHYTDGDVDGYNEKVKLGLSVANDGNSKLTTLTHFGSSAGMIGPGYEIPWDPTDTEMKSFWVETQAGHSITKTPLLQADGSLDDSGTRTKMCANCHTEGTEIFLTEEVVQTQLDAQPADVAPEDVINTINDLDWAIPTVNDRLPKTIISE